MSSLVIKKKSPGNEMCYWWMAQKVRISRLLLVDSETCIYERICISCTQCTSPFKDMNVMILVLIKFTVICLHHCWPSFSSETFTALLHSAQSSHSLLCLTLTPSYTLSILLTTLGLTSGNWTFLCWCCTVVFKTNQLIC